jgi:hypothetical protein
VTPVFLIQLLLPVYDNRGQPLLRHIYDSIRDELIAKFGGLTGFTQTPAEGFWAPEGKLASKDEIIVVEVMVPEIDKEWWRRYRATLEMRLKQETVVIRSLPIRLL